MLKYISSFFWGDSGTDLTFDEAYNILKNAIAKDEESLEPKEDTATNSNSEYSCYRKTGVITSKIKECYSIDNLYEFNANLINLEVGSQVSFTIYDSHGKIKVTDLTVIDDWYSGPSDLKSFWCVRSIIGKINKREGRMVDITPGDISIDLNDVASEFIPIVGDWVEVEAKVEIDENVTDLCGKILEVNKIRPLRPRILEGKIKEWCPTTKSGCINRVAYFNQDALVAGYAPAIGDKVITEIIESEQGRFVYRALKVVSDKQKFSNAVFENKTEVDFVTDSDDIYISNDIDIKSKRLGERRTFAFDVTNKSDEPLMLMNVTLETNTKQYVFVKPEILYNILIMPYVTKNFEGECVTKNVGVTKELVLFTFGKCKIGRWITVSVEIDHAVFDKRNSSNRDGVLLHTEFRQDRSMVRGQRVVAPPRFIAARLPDYPVPMMLLDLVKRYGDSKKSCELLEKLRNSKPSLNLTLSYNIYEDRFHTLLHLEEIFEKLALSSYACDLTCFLRNGEYLMLEIKNLSERRPSLMLGDRIIAKDPYNKDAVEFEGFIHKLGAKHVYLKFAPSYHNSYNGEDVSVIAVASRSTFRRMNQAVGLAVRNLGHSFLFPSKVDKKKAQSSFIYDDYCDEINHVFKVDVHGVANSKTQDFLETNGEERQIPTEKHYDKTNIKSQLLLTGVDSNVKTKHKYDVPLKNTPQRTLKLKWYNKSLNYFQKEAIRNILVGEARPLPYLIFGPPGTGKTVTLVEAILQILCLIPHSRLLVATPSNSAADLIALRLIDSGVLKPGDLIRLVAYRCVVEDMLPLKLIPYCATVDIAKEGTRKHDFVTNANGLTLGCSSSVIGRHRVTVGTCSALGVLFNMNFPKGHFSHIIVDEAGQLTEPEILIPLVFLDVFSGQVILAGDPLQLGPIISSQAAVAYGLDETFLDRMLNRFPYIRDTQGFSKTSGYDPRLITRLIYNYRSLPEVLKLTSDLFYDGELIPTISPHDSEEAQLLKKVQEILPLKKNLSSPSVVFHGVRGGNLQTSDCPSWFNPNEASQIYYYVIELYRLGVKSTDVGIISPYIKQVRQIRSLLAEVNVDIPKVGTVEEFQGQEFPIILLSTVRSNENLIAHDLTYSLGFLSMPKRVNVAISRARALLIIVGNPHLLCSDIHWRRVIQYCVENESYCGCALPGVQ